MVYDEFNSIFEIPIYRLNNQQFEKELSSYVTKSIPYQRKEITAVFGEKGKSIYNRVWNDFKLISEYNWKFNEIIGWVTLHLNDEYIFGEIFLNKSKRITKNSKAKISFYDSAFKIPFNQKCTNKKIYKQILNSLIEVEKCKKFKYRYIDKSKFEILGPFIDWKKLYKSLNN